MVAVSGGTTHLVCDLLGLSEADSGEIPAVLRALPAEARSALASVYGSAGLRSLTFLAREENAALFAQSLYHLGVRLEDSGHWEAALRVYRHLVGAIHELPPASAVATVPGGWAIPRERDRHESPLQIPPEIRRQARERLDAIEGRGALLPRIGFHAQHFFSNAFDAPSIVAMGVAGPVFQAARATALLRLARPLGPWLGRAGLGAVANSLAFGAEAISFTATTRLGNAILQRDQDWSGAVLWHEFAGGALTLLGLKFTGRMAGAAVSRWGTARTPLGGVVRLVTPQLGMYAGIVGTHYLEERLGFRDAPADESMRYLDGLATLFQFHVGGYFARRFVEPHLAPLTRAAAARTAEVFSTVGADLSLSRFGGMSARGGRDGGRTQGSPLQRLGNLLRQAALMPFWMIMGGAIGEGGGRTSQRSGRTSYTLDPEAGPNRVREELSRRAWDDVRQSELILLYHRHVVFEASLLTELSVDPLLLALEHIPHLLNPEHQFQILEYWFENTRHHFSRTTDRRPKWLQAVLELDLFSSNLGAGLKHLHDLTEGAYSKDTERFQGALSGLLELSAREPNKTAAILFRSLLDEFDARHHVHWGYFYNHRSLNMRRTLPHQVAEQFGNYFRVNSLRDDGGLLQLERFWRQLGLVAIEFSDGGNGYSTIPGFMDGYLSGWEAANPLRHEGVRYDATEIAFETLAGIKRDFEAEGMRLGRSVVYRETSVGNLLVFKHTRPEQRAVELVREVQWLTLLARSGIREKLQSELPVPLANTNGDPIVVLEERPSHRGPRIDFMGSYDPRGGAIAFVAPREYFRYLDDPTLSDAEFHRGLSRAIHDVFFLARHDVFHTAPIRLFHNAEAGAKHRATGDQGRYVLAPDILFGYRTRAGMGRLNDWPGALRYGNFGVTGLRDFEELASRSEIMEDMETWAPEFRRLFDGADRRSRSTALLETMLLGNSLLAATLYVGNRIAQRAGGTPAEAEMWRNDEALRPYAAQLLDLFATGYAARREISLPRARSILQPRADWLRLARQLAFFMTPSYVPYLRSSTAIKDFPAEAIYGPGVSIGEYFPGEARPPLMGPYRRGTFDEERGFIGPSGNPEELSLGAVNGQFPIREFEKAFWSVFLEPPHEENGDR